MSEPAEPSSRILDDVDPKWVRVADRIVADIERGALRIGERLPAERDLCVQLDVSRVTLRRAFASLEEQGVLRASRGRGWFVSGRASLDYPGRVESFIGAADRMGLETTVELLESTTLPAGTGDAAAFGVAEDSPITTLVRLRSMDGDAVAVETFRLRSGSVPGDLREELGAEPDHQRFMVLLAEHGFEFTRATGTVGATIAGDRFSGWLHVDPATALVELRVDVLGRDDRGQDVLLLETRLVYGDRFPLRVWFD